MKQKIILMAILLSALQACSQKKETMTIQNPNINASNIVEELTKEVQHYSEESMYIISYRIQYCFVEVLVNDIPVYKEFKDIGGYSAFDINQAILKNGTQKVTFRMYPIKKIEGDPNIYNAFIKETDVELEVGFYNHREKNTKETIVKKYKTPRKSNPDKRFTDSIFAFEGQTYYEDSFTFEAQVPYRLQNFDKARDLRKIDKKELETKLLRKYAEIHSFYENNDYDNIARISFDGLKAELISYYYDAEGAQEMWDNWMKISKHNIKMQPIENYEMKFFADGKLAALMTKSQEPEFRGNTALWGKFKEDGEETAFKINAYFYLLEGENDFRVY
jgi:hypothetical protein